MHSLALLLQLLYETPYCFVGLVVVVMKHGSDGDAGRLIVHVDGSLCLSGPSLFFLRYKSQRLW
jgi:hypothetical protein